MSIKQQFLGLSTTKKVLVIFGALVVIGLPFQALESSEREAKAAAAYAAMTPEQRAAHNKATFCQLNPDQCRLMQDAEVNLVNARKAAAKSQ